MLPKSPISDDADPMTGRRAFLGAVGSALAAASLSTFAQQQPPTLRRIGFLGSESASNQAKRLEALRTGLRELDAVVVQGDTLFASTPKRLRASR